MRLRAGLHVLDRPDGRTQVGTDPRWATLLDGLGPDDRALLRELTGPHGAAAPQVGAPGHALVRRLGDAGLLVPADRAGVPRTSSAARSGLRDDVLALERTTGAEDAAALVAARARRCVAVLGLGRVGQVVVDTLASAGVGRFLLDDPREVRRGDVGVGGLREPDVGAPRGRATAAVLARRHPGAQVGDVTREAPDVVVLVLDEVADVLRTVRLMVEGVAHLAVTVREGDVVVGPFVVPGVTACLNCQDLSRGDADGDWPSLREQLKDQGGREPSGQETVVSGVAGALAAAQVLAYLDGREPATAGASIEVETPDATPRLRGWSRHPRCGCVDVVRT